MSNNIFILTVFGSVSLIALTFSTMSFYNIECKSFDKSFIDFEYCYIKAVNRSLKYYSVKANLFKLPITKASIRITCSYRANGWKPFLYNVTIDLCKFLKSKRSKNFIGHIYNSIDNYTNVNHTCPVNHDIEINNVPSSFLNNMWTKILPTPEGQYRTEVFGLLENIVKFKAVLYVKIS